MAGSYFKHHKYLYTSYPKVKSCLRWEYNFKTLFEVWQKAKTTLYYKDIYYNSSHDNASYMHNNFCHVVVRWSRAVWLRDKTHQYWYYIFRVLKWDKNCLDWFASFRKWHFQIYFVIYSKDNFNKSDILTGFFWCQRQTYLRMIHTLSNL